MWNLGRNGILGERYKIKWNNNNNNTLSVNKFHDAVSVVDATNQHKKTKIYCVWSSIFTRNAYIQKERRHFIRCKCRSMRYNSVAYDMRNWQEKQTYDNKKNMRREKEHFIFNRCYFFSLSFASATAIHMCVIPDAVSTFDRILRDSCGLLDALYVMSTVSYTCSYRLRRLYTCFQF